MAAGIGRGAPPVVRLTFGGSVVESRAQLDQKIGEQLRINQATLGVGCTELTPDGCLAQLIREAHAATGEAVYNPFDLLLLFQKRRFHPWWFEVARLD